MPRCFWIFSRRASTTRIVACPICPYSECLPVLNKLRVEGLNNLLSELAKAEEDDVTSSLQPSKKIGDKTKVTEIAVELAGEDKSCAATNAAASPVRFMTPNFRLKHSKKPLFADS